MPRGAEDAGIRRAEVVAALSLATDLALGAPTDFAMRTCVLAMRLGEALKVSDEELRDIYWYGLLRHVGCNAESHSVAAFFSDEIDFNREIAVTDVGKPTELMPLLAKMIRRANSGAPPLEALGALARGLAASRKFSVEVIGGHCEVGQRLAERLGFGGGVITALGQNQERWDGRGLPAGVKGEALAPAVRVVHFARDMVVFAELSGEAAALGKAKARSGAAYDPRVVAAFVKRPDEFMRGLDQLSSWDVVLDLDPEPHLALSPAEFDAACLAMADFTDIKSPHTAGHSRAVGALAAEAGRVCGLPLADCADLYRAGLIHDIGQTAISAGVWSKPGTLSAAEWEQVRLHAYYGERVLARPGALARLGAIVGQHHERLDGSGYHRGAPASGLTPQGRILAAAEAYQGMVEARPHRAALTAEQAAAALKREARAGRLDGEAVNAVLGAAGHVVPPARRELVAGLTGREIDVLRLVARGQSMKEIARSLGISPKTVDNHIQRVYAKIEVKTRAGATLFAIERGLSAPSGQA